MKKSTIDRAAVLEAALRDEVRLRFEAETKLEAIKARFDVDIRASEILPFLGLAIFDLWVASGGGIDKMPRSMEMYGHETWQIVSNAQDQRQREIGVNRRALELADSRIFKDNVECWKKELAAK